MKYKILIIEDESETSKFLSLALEKADFEVEIAETGTKGLQKIKQTKFDLIVLDLKMPGMTGDEVLKELRKIDPFIQVVVYTNYNDAPIMQKLINMEIDGFIKKGANADLWGTVEFIKSKFEPLEDDKRQELLDKLFTQINITSDNDLHS